MSDFVYFTVVIALALTFVLVFTLLRGPNKDQEAEIERLREEFPDLEIERIGRGWIQKVRGSRGEIQYTLEHLPGVGIEAQILLPESFNTHGLHVRPRGPLQLTAPPDSSTHPDVHLRFAISSLQGAPPPLTAEFAEALMNTYRAVPKVVIHGNRITLEEGGSDQTRYLGRALLAMALADAYADLMGQGPVSGRPLATADQEQPEEEIVPIW